MKFVLAIEVRHIARMRLQTGLYFLGIILSAGVASAQPAATPLVVAIPEGLAAPMLFVKEGSQPTGIVVDISKSIAKELGREPELMLLTHYRLHDSLTSGRADILCFANPSWGKNADAYNWSKPMFAKREVILGPSPAPADVSGFTGKTIGTVLNYTYPKLDKLFAAKSITREDSYGETANLLKLEKGRLQYAITDETVLDYFKQTHPDIEKNRQRFPLQDYAISCNMNRKSTIKIKDLNRAIERLKNSGRFDQIFKSYGTRFEPL
ncbi:ABC transporter substrate-binding protein [Bdellovibrio sp. NC01]|uniref:substrate-binding periplasmic protein n=1 Tax=Bdellovibrio sp. NC01 TaxID=2220073 RepID=UPI001159D6DA|nr:transporter substrate-binding domain-containing protein [Bdellovibrio sp. NC01]QDK37585.1 amino acid ABC transporter [Bdellovibrio sp. NC01]